MKNSILIAAAIVMFIIAGSVSANAELGVTQQSKTTRVDAMYAKYDGYGRRHMRRHARRVRRHIRRLRRSLR